MPDPFEGREVKVIVDAGCLFEMARHPAWWPLWSATYVAAEGDEALLERMDPVEQLGYLREHREAFAQGSEGPPKTPKAKGSGDLSEDEARSRAWNVRHGGF
jgi:hypothetical protein